MKISLKVSLGGLIAALGLALMFMTTLIPVSTYAFPVFAGILLVVAVIELGYGFSLLIYVVTAVLSFLLVPDKEAALMYAVFFGFYPVLKSLIERIPGKPVQYIVKYLLFNVCIIAAFFIAVNLLSIPKDSYNFFGLNMPLILLVLANAFFIVYDICITRIVTVYLLKWHDKLNKNTKL